uniref:DAGKc domain-containing protein n=1 Tax=Plectus sambesii TaxID=2011161 RepID=A0A914XL44_9BILA
MTSRIVSLFSTLRTHKKKTIFFSSCLALLVDYGLKQKRDSDILEVYCKEAQKIGRQTISADSKPRRVTVLLNGFAKDGKARKLFENNALPLLNLAGLEVNVLKVESADKLETVAGALDKQEADALYVVGGDGTLSRVLTGVFNNRTTPALPIGVFPGGWNNESLSKLAPSVFGLSNRANVRWFCESAMALINDTRKPVHVFKVDSQTEEGNVKTVYALSNTHGGWFRNIEEKKYKYWYWFRLKRRFTYFWETLKASPKPIVANIQYESFCPGCNKCRSAAPTKAVVAAPQWRWWHVITGTPRYVTPEQQRPRRDYSTIVNDNCGAVQEVTVSTTDLLVENVQEEDCSRLRISAGGEGLGRLGVISEGWGRCGNDATVRSHTENFYSFDADASKVNIEFSQLPEKCEIFSVSGDRIDVSKGPVRVETVPQPIELYLPKMFSFGANVNAS